MRAFNLNHYFDRHVCPSMRPYVSMYVCMSQNFFSLKSPWGHPLTPEVDPSPRPPGHAAPSEELAKARRAFSSKCIRVDGSIHTHTVLF